MNNRLSLKLFSFLLFFILLFLLFLSFFYFIIFSIPTLQHFRTMSIVNLCKMTFKGVKLLRNFHFVIFRRFEAIEESFQEGAGGGGGGGKGGIRHLV